MLVYSARYYLGSIERDPDRFCTFRKPDWVSCQKCAESSKEYPIGQEVVGQPKGEKGRVAVRTLKWDGAVWSEAGMQSRESFERLWL